MENFRTVFFKQIFFVVRDIFPVKLSSILPTLLNVTNMPKFYQTTHKKNQNEKKEFLCKKIFQKFCSSCTATSYPCFLLFLRII